MSDRHITGEFRFPSDLAEGRRLQDEIEEALQACGYGERDVFSIRLALEEALVNAIKHGNQMDPAKWVSGQYDVGPDQFEVRIADEGPGFNPADLPDPTDPENIERSCGRGVFLIRHYMNTVEYPGKGNVVVMTKVRNREVEEE
jgi:serine/threonine-protein kinase RsbW